jgi:pimeloyl-ACP methyl ester carboxylesterase
MAEHGEAPTQPPDLSGCSHRELTVGTTRLHYVEAGRSGPTVVLLHGFPELWYSWRRQLPALAAAGLHAVAPDLRGYNLSDRPAGVANYRVRALLADVEGLIRAAAGGPAFVVGHDWGGLLAWRPAGLAPGWPGGRLCGQASGPSSASPLASQAPSRRSTASQARPGPSSCRTRAPASRALSA